MARQVKGWLIAYLIGVFDGEGYINIHPVKPKGYLSYQVKAAVGMTSEYLPRLFQATYGGRVYFEPKTGNEKDEWRWILRTQQAKPLLEDIVKYGILKKPQAEVALHLLSLQHGGVKGKSVSDEEKVLREVDCILMHKLNKRGR